MNLSNLQLPPPTNWQDFESLCCDLWKEIWSDPNAKKNGRLGQEQCGVDIYGRPNQESRWAGVQCKGKDSYSHKNLTEREVKLEVEKAKDFQPPISSFILATTGPKDASIERLAREITEAHLSKNMFSVDVWAWGDIVRELSYHAAVLRVHYEGLLENFETLRELEQTSQAILEKQSGIEKSQSEVKQSLSAIGLNIQNLSVAQLPTIPIGREEREAVLSSEYQAELDVARDLVNACRYKNALEYGTNLKNRIWHSALPNVRYRLLTNIGAAKLKLNEEQEAARLFVEALQYNPEDEKALGNLALGYLLLGEIEEAHDACNKLLEKNPLSTRAYFVLIQTSGLEEQLGDIVSKAPPPLRDEPEVAFAIGWQAHRQGNLSEAIKWIEVAVNKEKGDSAESKAILAGLIIESIVRDEATIIQLQLDQEQRERIERARDLLSSSWTSAADTDLRGLRPNWILNRGIAKKLLGDIDGAVEDAETALSIEPENPIFMKHRAILAKLAGTKQETNRAIELLRKIRSNSQTPEAGLILGESLFEDKRTLEARTVVEEFIASNPSQECDADAKRLLASISLELGDSDRARQLAQELISNDPSDILNFVVASQIESKLQNDDVALSLLIEAEKLITETSHPVDLMYLANAFSTIQVFQSAASVYEKIANTDLDSHLTRRLLRCYYNCDKLDLALNICSNLRSRYGPLEFVSEMESFIYEQIDDLPRAMEVCEQYLLLYPDHFVMKLRLAVVWLRSKSFKAVDDFLASNIEFDALTIETGLQLAQLYAARNQELKWFTLMYELRRRFYGDARSHLYYVIQFFRKNRDDCEWLRPEVVSLDSAVEVKDSSGRKKWHIIEDRLNPDFSRSEMNPTHPLAQRLLGASVGDRIVLTKNFLTEEEGEICEIKSKYIHALHTSMELYETLFPERPGLWSIRVTDSGDEGDPQKGMQVFLDQITRDHNRRTEAQELYKKGQLTLGSIASMIGPDPLKVWSSFINNPDVGVRCCNGDILERDSALASLSTRGIRLVIDLVSLMTIYSSGIADEIVGHFGKLAIAQATIDQLQRVIDDRAMFMDRGLMTVGKEGDQFVREEIAPEQVKEYVEYLQSLMAWIDGNTDVIPCSAALSMPKERTTQLREMLGEDSFDTILISTDATRLLFSDDRQFRSLAKHEFGVNGVWTQAVLMHLLNGNVIDRSKYNDSIIKLVSFNYYYTSIDPDVLLEAAKRSDWFPKYPYTALLRNLSAEKSDEPSTLSFTADFIFKLWGKPVLPQMSDSLIFALLDAVVRGRGPTQFIRQLIPLVSLRFKLIPFDQERVISLVRRWSRTKLVES